MKSTQPLYKCATCEEVLTIEKAADHAFETGHERFDRQLDAWDKAHANPATDDEDVWKTPWSGTTVTTTTTGTTTTGNIAWAKTNTGQLQLWVDE